MNTGFIGSNLRRARQFNDLSLTELGDKVGVSKQFLSRIETGEEDASGQLQASLADELQVRPEFFHRIDTHPIADEQCHFRRQLTSGGALVQWAGRGGRSWKQQFFAPQIR
jgi:transcriptional regulator with XRE-family HTH domain